MKKTLSFIMAAALVCNSAAICSPASVSAIEAATYYEYSQLKNNDPFPDPEASYKTVEKDEFVFNVYEDFALLTNYKNREAKEAVIPDTIDGVPVVGITNTPFGYCRSLESITIPDSLTHFNWFDLTNTMVTVLGSTEEPMPSVKEVKISPENKNYVVSDGILYTSDMKTLIGCPPALDIKEAKISEQAETISDYAFYANMSLEKAEIPENIKHINNNAFTACMNLKSVSLPSAITKISGDMFYFCKSLEEVTFNGDITTIGYGSFAECTSLKSFDIPDTVTCIGRDAFLNDTFLEDYNGIYYNDNWLVGSDENIKEAIVADGTIGIAEQSFFVRNSCSRFIVPASVKYVGDMVFAGLLSSGASVIEYSAHTIGERTLAFAKATTDIYIFDPECVIADSEKSIPAEYTLRPTDPDIIVYQSKMLSDVSSEVTKGDLVIHGYEGSTAQEYAKKYNRKFEVIEREKGDVNCDGEFNVADVLLVEKWLLGAEDIGSSWKYADLCKDGKLNTFDFVAIRELLTATEK